MNRLRLLQVVTVLLYVGPLIAGMARMGWAHVAAFSAVFLLWQIVMRPLDWPRDAARWSDRALQAAALARILILVLIVAVLFGIGRGIGGVFGHLPAIPALAPLGLSFLAVPLARLIWDPAQGAATDRFLDEALGQGKAASPDLDHLAEGTAKADLLLQPVQDLPDGTPPETLADHLKVIATHVDDARLREALLARARSGGASPALLSALAIHATDPRLMDVPTPDGAARAFAALPDHAPAVALFASRAVAALKTDPGLWWALPTSDVLAARASHLAGTEAEAALMSLMAATDTLAQRNAG